jgi:hypothetical protein
MKLLHHIRSNSVAYAALFIALGGSSYAAVTINGSQIRNRTINPVKLNPRFINGNTRAWAIVRPNGTLLAGSGRPRPGFNPPNDYVIGWGVNVGRCATQATVDGAASPVTGRIGYATAATVGGRGGETFVQTYNESGQPTPLAFDLTVTC